MSEWRPLANGKSDEDDLAALLAKERADRARAKQEQASRHDGAVPPKRRTDGD